MSSWPAVTMGAGTVACFSLNDTCSLSGSLGGVFSTWPSQNGTSTLWASQKEEDWGLVFLASVISGRVALLNRCWWMREHRPLGWIKPEQSLHQIWRESIAGSWPLPRRNSGILVFWTTSPSARAVTERRQSHGSVTQTHKLLPRFRRFP